MSEHEIVLTRRIYVGAAAEEVWLWLVEPERVRQYALAELAERPAAPGDPVRYTSKIGGQVVIDGVAEEVLEGRRLVHTFQFQIEYPDPPSRVTLELLRYGDAMCCIELRHEGLLPGSDTHGSVSTSWDVMLSSLKTLVETGRPLPWPGRSRGRV